jgi:hypothetical protein
MQVTGNGANALGGLALNAIAGFLSILDVGRSVTHDGVNHRFGHSD